MEKRLTFVRETGGAIRHESFTLRSTNRDTQVSFAGFTEQTFATFCGVKRNNMVARFNASDAFTHFHNNAGTFVPQNRREDTFRIVNRQGKCIGMTDTGVGYFYQNFTFTRWFHINLNDLKRLTRSRCNSCT